VAAIRQSLSIGDRKRTLAQLKTDVNTYMAEFEELEALEKVRVKTRESGTDAEGFTLVTGRNKRKKAHAGETGKSKARKRQKKHKGTAELKNFYRFQFREHKRDALLTLREAFAKDQETIAALKEKRKFKPF
jgi:ribosomal RNA-processing protein 7